MLRACLALDEACEWLLIPCSPLLVLRAGRARHVALTDWICRCVLFKATQTTNGILKVESRWTANTLRIEVCHFCLITLRNSDNRLLLREAKRVSVQSTTPSTSKGFKMSSRSVIGCGVIEAGEVRLFLAQPRRCLTLIGHTHVEIRPGA